MATRIMLVTFYDKNRRCDMKTIKLDRFYMKRHKQSGPCQKAGFLIRNRRFDVWRVLSDTKTIKFDRFYVKRHKSSVPCQKASMILEAFSVHKMLNTFYAFSPSLVIPTTVIPLIIFSPSTPSLCP